MQDLTFAKLSKNVQRAFIGKDPSILPLATNEYKYTRYDSNNYFEEKKRLCVNLQHKKKQFKDIHVYTSFLQKTKDW